MSATPEAVTDRPDARKVAVIADSEVPAEVVDLLEADPAIVVTSRVTESGWTIRQLDDGFDAALASKPDVLVYSAGANDLSPSGIGGMMALLEVRLDVAMGATCVVSIVPAVDTASMEEPGRSQADQLLAAFKEVLLGWGVSVVSYPEVAVAMAAHGDRFFDGDGLSSFHPGPAAYEPIADAIAKEIASCP